MVLWESPGRYFIIGRPFWDLFGASSCRFCSIAQQCGAQLPTKLQDKVVRSAGFLAGGVLDCNLAHRRSAAELCMLFKIKSNPMHPLRCALPLPYEPKRVSRDLVAHWHSFAPPRCFTSHNRRTFVPLSASLWNYLSDPVFDLVGLAGFKSRANVFLLAWSALSFLSPSILSSSLHGLVVWGWGFWTDRVFTLSPGLAQRTPNNNNNNKLNNFIYKGYKFCNILLLTFLIQLDC